MAPRTSGFVLNSEDEAQRFFGVSLREAYALDLCDTDDPSIREQDCGWCGKPSVRENMLHRDSPTRGQVLVGPCCEHRDDVVSDTEDGW